MPTKRLRIYHVHGMVLRMEILTDDAGETSGNVPRPRSYFGNDHADNGPRTRCVPISLPTNVTIGNDDAYNGLRTRRFQPKSRACSKLGRHQSAPHVVDWIRHLIHILNCRCGTHLSRTIADNGAPDLLSAIKMAYSRRPAEPADDALLPVVLYLSTIRNRPNYR
ncbi:unnamed protein product [Protopolystoma xenopodis]|uniref:Uncharacterized protein n=1 Tax=Protopolystoma xenopodis TaxID=117903 RepID=A0A3S5FF84_9PLAT|nr:unnamed protein product [Protopolystoma xenopodis]